LSAITTLSERDWGNLEVLSAVRAFSTDPDADIRKATSVAVKVLSLEEG
jgi:hypothetical protein